MYHIYTYIYINIPNCIHTCIYNISNIYKYIQLYPIYISNTYPMCFQHISNIYPNISKHIQHISKHIQIYQNTSNLYPNSQTHQHISKYIQIRKNTSGHRNTPELPKPIFKYLVTPNKYTRRHRNQNENIINPKYPNYSTNSQSK